MKSVVKYMIALLMVSPLILVAQAPQHTDLMKTVMKRSNGPEHVEEAFKANPSTINTLVWNEQEGIYHTATDLAARRKTKTHYNYLTSNGGLTGAQIRRENVTNFEGSVLEHNDNNNHHIN